MENTSFCSRHTRKRRLYFLGQRERVSSLPSCIHTCKTGLCSAMNGSNTGVSRYLCIALLVYRVTFRLKMVRQVSPSASGAHPREVRLPIYAVYRRIYGHAVHLRPVVDRSRLCTSGQAPVPPLWETGNQEAPQEEMLRGGATARPSWHAHCNLGRESVCQKELSRQGAVVFQKGSTSRSTKPATGFVGAVAPLLCAVGISDPPVSLDRFYTRSLYFYVSLAEGSAEREERGSILDGVCVIEPGRAPRSMRGIWARWLKVRLFLQPISDLRSWRSLIRRRRVIW